MSRKGQLWRGELAQRIDEYLTGGLTIEELVDWAVDHPFFDEQDDVEQSECVILGSALGMILQRSTLEPLITRTSDEQLSQVARELWG